MKALYVLIAITLAAIAMCLFLAHHIITTCDELIGIKDEALLAVLAGDFDAAQGHFSRLEKRWFELENGWEMLCDHDDLSVVSTSVMRAAILCGQREGNLLELECAQLEMALLTLSHKETVSIENII